MAIQPVPPLVLAAEFPTNADRTAGVWNAKANAWAGSENAMATSVRNISSVTWNNANEAFNFSTAANQSKIDAEAFKNQAQGYATSAGGSAAVVGRWDKLVLGPKSLPPTVDNDGQPLLVGAEYYNTVLKARYSWNGTAWAIGTNVTAGVASVDGMSGTVVLDKGAFVYTRPNKIVNASFARNFDSWSMASDSGRTDWVLQDIAQGLKAAMLLNVQGQASLVSANMPVVGGRQYKLAAETIFTGATGGATQLFIEWRDASLVYISSSYGTALGVSGYPADLANRKANLISAAAPANAAFARIVFWGVSLTGPANIGIHRPKFQESAAGTNDPMLFTDDATIELLGQASGARGQQTYTTSQTINKSVFGLATYVEVEMWGGGASGGAAVSTAAGSGDRAGGEGGEYVRFVARVADLPASIALVIGAGGVAVTATASGTAVLLNGNPGGDTSFNGIVAPGGIVDPSGSGQNGASKQYLQGKNGGDGGGSGLSTGLVTRRVAGPGGSSIYGGAGGGTSLAGSTAAGSSTFGGAGGLGVVASSTGATAGSGAAAGGGGGGIRYNATTGTATSGAGGRGEIRLRWW